MALFQTRVAHADILCAEERAGSSTLVVFGASGDLSRTKLFPALMGLFKRELQPEFFHVIGVGRTQKSGDDFRRDVEAAVSSQAVGLPRERMDAFLAMFDYVSGDYADERVYREIAARCGDLKRRHPDPAALVFYLATPPSLFTTIVQALGRSGLAAECRDKPNCARAVVEKPFGYDLASARELDRLLAEHFREKQVYRIDHYMGKETVQNMMMFRFANTIFEPLWNRNYVDHIQITTAEASGIGRRAGYFDGVGLMRDVFQNHMLQMLAMVAMEPPASFAAERVRDERVKLLRSVRPFAQGGPCCTVVRGQYAAGAVGGERVPGYREEAGVPEGSTAETFVAAEFWIDNWRWQGVPFYLRAGKRLARRVSEIAIAFKRVPHSMFAPLLPEDLAANALVFNVQPEEGISLAIQAKSPGPKLCMNMLTMDFQYRKTFDVDLPEAYERLLLDCMNGDQSLFIRSDALEVAWRIVDPVCAAWQESASQPLMPYEAGSQGPAEADALIERTGRHWRPL